MLPAKCISAAHILAVFLILILAGYVVLLAQKRTSDGQMTLKMPSSEPKNIVIIGMEPLLDSIKLLLTIARRWWYHRLFYCILPYSPYLL